MMRCCCCIEDCILDCRVNRMNEKLVERMKSWLRLCCSKVDLSVFSIMDVQNWGRWKARTLVKWKDP